MPEAPRRMRLSRLKGFKLQQASRALGTPCHGDVLLRAANRAEWEALA